MMTRPNMMAWAPAPMKRLPTPSSRPALGEQRTFLATKELAIATDIAVLTGSALMVLGTTTVKNAQGEIVGNKWSTFWWIASGITIMKILHDISRPY